MLLDFVEYNDLQSGKYIEIETKRKVQVREGEEKEIEKYISGAQCCEAREYPKNVFPRGPYV